MKLKKLRQKKCRVCKQKFQPFSSLSVTCGVKCAIEDSREKERKKAEKQHREDLARVKPNKHWLRETQYKAFNPYILVRDRHLPCMSCGTWDAEEFHAGHFRSIGSARHLRFNEDNVWKQCSQCNTHKSGNQTEYEIRLRRHIGDERVNALINSNEMREWTYEELKEKRAYYRAKTRELESEMV